MWEKNMANSRYSDELKQHILREVSLGTPVHNWLVITIRRRRRFIFGFEPVEASKRMQVLDRSESVH